MLKTYFHTIFRILHVSSVVLTFLLILPFLLIWRKNPKENFNNLVWARKWIGAVSSTLSGIFFKTSYQQPIDWSKNYIICANHTSNLDIPALLKTCPSNFVFMGKEDLLKNPVTKIFFETIDIAVDRDNKMSAYKAFRRASDYLKEGKTVIIFPEGKIGDNFPPELCPFKTGPFRLAIEHQIPILPIVIQNAWELYWDDGKKHGARPGTIQIDVLEPIETKYLTIADTENLKDLTYQNIQKHGHIYNKL